MTNDAVAFQFIKLWSKAEPHLCKITRSDAPQPVNALPCAGKGDHPNELDLAEVQIQVNQESKETFDFDQGTRKYGHIKFSQSIGLPPRNSYLVAIQELAARACLLVFCKLLQTFLQTQSLPAETHNLVFSGGYTKYSAYQNFQNPGSNSKILKPKP